MPLSLSFPFQVEIDVTPEGLANRFKVLTALFSYIELIRKKGIPDYLPAELSALSDLGWRFQVNKIAIMSVCMCVCATETCGMLGTIRRTCRAMEQVFLGHRGCEGQGEWLGDFCRFCIAASPCVELDSGGERPFVVWY